MHCCFNSVCARCGNEHFLFLDFLYGDLSVRQFFFPMYAVVLLYVLYVFRLNRLVIPRLSASRGLR